VTCYLDVLYGVKKSERRVLCPGRGAHGCGRDGWTATFSGTNVFAGGTFVEVESVGVI
jgi:hypothetical protein